MTLILFRKKNVDAVEILACIVVLHPAVNKHVFRVNVVARAVVVSDTAAQDPAVHDEVVPERPGGRHLGRLARRCAPKWLVRALVPAVRRTSRQNTAITGDNPDEQDDMPSPQCPKARL